jgi:cysteinyl-tRNA synthetase
MIAMIAELVARGHAYAKEGHVLFRVRSYKDYGRLSGRSVDDMIAGARVEVAPFKEDPMDFVLWKPSDADLPGWESPWGRGRPGWHIECSAMAHELLGESFDIHGGGIDLQFPHHENEIAQSACAHPGGGFAKVWMHNEMLMVEGRKMSKSLGNFFTVRDLLDKGIPGEVIRFVFLQTHYSKPMDWTEEKARAAEATLRKWQKLTDGAEQLRRPHLDVVEALADDLNTSLAIARLHAHAAAIGGKEDASRFLATLGLLGIGTDWRDGVRVAVDRAFGTVSLLDGIIERLAAARRAKDWATADSIKSALTGAGVKIMIGPDGISRELTPDFDPAKLESLK